MKKVTEIVSKWILRDKSLALTKNALTHPTEYSLDKENRRRFPTSPAYDVLLTLVNPDPEKLKVNWSLPTIADGEILVIVLKKKLLLIKSLLVAPCKFHVFFY